MLQVPWPEAKLPPAACPAQPVGNRLDLISCRSAVPSPRRFGHGFADLHIAGTAAKIYRKPLTNFIHRRLRMFAQQMSRRKDHSRCADAALRTPELQKSLLQV